MSKLIIYGLIDPRSGELRYVGKSCSGLMRPRQHTAPSNLARDDTHKGRWLRQLLATGLKPDIEVLETRETAEALVEAEQHFISYFRSIGCRLTNETDGGEGAVGRKFAAASLVKMSASRRGQGAGVPKTVEHRSRISKALAGRTKTTEHRAKLAQSSRGKVDSDATTLRRSRAHGGRPFRDQNGASYSTIRGAARSLGLDPSHVHRVLDGKMKQVKGYVFAYA